MSTFSEAWHNTPPAVRDFYRNFSVRYTRLAGTIPPHPDFPEDNYFATFGRNFQGHRGFDVAQHNWGAQLMDFGSFNVAIVLIEEHEFWSDPSPGPVFNAFRSDSFGAALIDIPKYCWNHPCPKRNAKKSYWTGKPRRRRNL